VSDFFGWLSQFVRDLFPLREVAPWERGIMIVCNRWIYDLTPGVYVVVPFFMEVSTATTVPNFFFTPLLTVTLRDARTLTFTCSAEVCVIDARKALLEVDKYRESVVEALSSVVAEELVEADPERLESLRSRRALMKGITATVNEQVGRFGVELRTLRFANFAFIKAYRLMNDSATSGASW
jgi:hypothetical protein